LDALAALDSRIVFDLFRAALRWAHVLSVIFLIRLTGVVSLFFFGHECSHSRRGNWVREPSPLTPFRFKASSTQETAKTGPGSRPRKNAAKFRRHLWVKYSKEDASDHCANRFKDPGALFAPERTS
jgi:hypothetical protein